MLNKQSFFKHFRKIAKVVITRKHLRQWKQSLQNFALKNGGTEANVIGVGKFQ